MRHALSPGVLLLVLGATLLGQDARAASPGAERRAFLDKHCVTCHNQRLLTAGLALDTVDVDALPETAVWEKVVRRLRSGAMPPVGRPRPAEDAVRLFVRGVEADIDARAARNPHPGRTAAHRLNRAEYANAVRELLALDIDATSLLPPDDAGYGFDNIGDVLSVSPMLMERYMAASAKISRLAVGVSDPGPSSQTYTLSKYIRQDDRMSEDLPFGSRGGLAVQHVFPMDAEYELRVRLLKNHRDQIRGMSQWHELEVRIDGERARLFRVGRNPTVKVDPEEMQRLILHGDEDLNLRVTTTAGPHQLAVAFVDRPAVAEGPLASELSVASFGFSGAAVDADQQPAVWTLRVDGPFNPRPATDTPSRRRIFVCRPDEGGGVRTALARASGAELSCARRIMSTLARRAYRRPVTDGDVKTLLAFFEQGRARGGFDVGIEVALRRMLASPEFLFRIERDPATPDASTAYRLSEIELASRLSFFLWSGIPDDELLDLAEHGQLRRGMAQQIRRMLRDPRATALVKNFAGQWLYLRNLQGVAPDPNLFPEFDDNLREAFRQETELFFGSQLRENRSVMQLLTSDHTFLNERLARHYGVPGVYGSHFRRVSVGDNRRHGLLGHGSILTVTSYATRTSPVLRGKWLLENVLGAPPPAPPPNVPALKEVGEKGVAPSSVRQRMEQHRRNPVCASCHAQMDPLGFALENFDAVGKWRTTAEGGAPIDTRAILPNGRAIDGPAEMRAALLSDPEAFVTTVAEKLLTYAIGRGLDHHDAPAIRRIVRSAATDDYRWTTLIESVIDSVPFQMRAVETRSPQP